MSTPKTTRKYVMHLLFLAVTATMIPASSYAQGAGSNEKPVLNSSQSKKVEGKILSIVSMRDRYLASNPGKKSFNLMRHKNKGYRFFADSRVLYVTQGLQSVKTMTRISSANSQKVCIASVGNFSGGCFTLAESNGKMFLHYKFGTGADGVWNVRVMN